MSSLLVCPVGGKEERSTRGDAEIERFHCMKRNLSYTDPMGHALVCMSTVEPQLYRPYGTCTSLYEYSGTSVIQTLWDLH